MRRYSRLASLALVLTVGCGGGAVADPAVQQPVKDPKEPNRPSNFPSAAGSWHGTATYSRCEESDGFGFCASLHVPKMTSFQTTMTQSAQTHSLSGLIVADVSGTFTFDGMTGNLRGVIDDIGSIFLDDDVFVAPISPTRTARIRNWTSQLYNGAWFGNFRIFVTPTNGSAGQAIVTVTLGDVARS